MYLKKKKCFCSISWILEKLMIDNPRKLVYFPTYKLLERRLLHFALQREITERFPRGLLLEVLHVHLVGDAALVTPDRIGRHHRDTVHP